MNIDEQHYLDLAEKTSDLVFFDIESTGFKADYGSVLVVSLKPFGKEPFSFAVNQVGNDQKVVRQAREALGRFGCWVSFYGKGFDKPFLNTRLLKWKQPPLESRHHLDLFFTLKYNMSMSRKSLLQYAGFLDLEDKKFGVSPNVWSSIAYKPENMKLMIKRCEQDCITLEQLYVKTRHIVKEIKRG